MSKKLGLDKKYSSLLTSVNKNSVLNKINLSGSTGMKAYDSTKMLTNSIALGVKKPSQLTFGKKALSIGKKVLGRTPIGRAVNLAVNVGSGIGIGYSYAKNKFNKKKADFQKGDYSDIKTDKKMSGGMMQGYGAARTSGMGLEDQSLPPGKMVRANKGKMLNFKSDKERKDYTKQAIASLEGITESFKDTLNPMKAQRLLDRLPKKKIKKARFGDFMNTFIADDKRSVAGKSGGADSGTAGEMRSKLGKSDVVEKKKIKNYIKKKVKQGKTVIKKTKEAVKKTGTILATPIKKFHELAEENVRKNGPVRIFKRSYSKGGGMDMGAKKSLSFREQLEKARAEGKVEKAPTSKYLKKRSRGDRINALLKAARE